MNHSNIVEEMLQAIKVINVALYPLSIIIPVVLGLSFITTLSLNIRKPDYIHSLYLKITIAICYFYAGIPLLFTTKEMGSNAIIGGSTLIIFGLLFIFTLHDKKMIFLPSNRLILRIISGLLMFTGLLFYPVLEYITGFQWPGIAVFGMECPTTITVIGLFVLTMDHIPKYLQLILFTNAIITGTSVALMGATFDWSYAIAGYIGMLLLIINWRKSLVSSTSSNSM